MSDDLDRHRRVRTIFEQVRAEPPERVEAALAAACGGDSGLFEEVASLLSAANRADSFPERPYRTRSAAASGRRHEVRVSTSPSPRYRWPGSADDGRRRSSAIGRRRAGGP